MGLAASQARFLCITARKADCEYKTTALAQEKLDITKQLSDISTQYAQSMNATKLVWQNDAINADYGLTYSLMMMPTAANDYNPYMITSPSGAIVLNSEYAAAAKAAGISKAGGVGSQTSRDKFIAALAYGGLITSETANAITKYDYKVNDAETKRTGNIVFTNLETVPESNGISWNPAAGMGAAPLDKSGVSMMTFTDLCLSESIGNQLVDWAKLFVTDGKVTQNEYNRETERLNKLVAAVKTGVNGVNDDVVNQLRTDLSNYKSKNDESTSGYADTVKKYENLIKMASNIHNVNGSLELCDPVSGEPILIDGSKVLQSDALDKVKTQIEADLTTYKANSVDTVSIDGKFNTTSNSLKGGQYSVVENGVINHYKDEINSMTIGDVLSRNIVLMAKSIKADDFRKQCIKLLDSMSAIFGFSKTEDLSGQGLNVDDASNTALSFAYNMILNTYLKKAEIEDTGSRKSETGMIDNSAYQNAVNYNRIGSMEGNTYYAISLSNMMSAFLTYYENALTGVGSPYVVGKSTDTSSYVTDDLGYTYVAEADNTEALKIASKSADFYDQLYNNILERGWREDSAIDDAEYLEEALKDGRYSMTSLNQDGYHYQTRYNETGYMVEVTDSDAIARAEAEFTSMKAQLTYKEDTIDMKTKKLDAEISSLSTEYDTVKNLISKSIEKTFALFQN